MSDLIDRAAVQQAMKAKHAQLTEYHASFAGRDDPVGNYSRIIAEGRLLQLDADMALLALQPQN